jgi:hypothetical protein
MKIYLRENQYLNYNVDFCNYIRPSHPPEILNVKMAAAMFAEMLENNIPRSLFFPKFVVICRTPVARYSKYFRSHLIHMLETIKNMLLKLTQRPINLCIKFNCTPQICSSVQLQSTS